MNLLLRNRNIIKAKDGLKWLTIPVLTKGRYSQKISETKINGNDSAKYLKSFNYEKSRLST